MPWTERVRVWPLAGKARVERIGNTRHGLNVHDSPWQRGEGNGDNR